MVTKKIDSELLNLLHNMRRGSLKKIGKILTAIFCAPLWPIEWVQNFAIHPIYHVGNFVAPHNLADLEI